MVKDIPNVRCSICASIGSAQHFDLYVFGSEGVKLCPSCRVLVCNKIHDMAMDYQWLRKNVFIEAKKERATA